jgi:hypothetical protein
MGEQGWSIAGMVWKEKIKGCPMRRQAEVVEQGCVQTRGA